ncbi:MAG TPA: GNAT family N-acetyltransferase [Actinomycetota bacterium]|nr:GNAT family N-acetyltransferase [Actinomycetota bacterium]
MKAMVHVRPCVESDLAQLNDIYNHYVATSAATFDLQPVPMEVRRDWFMRYALTGPHRLFVATDGDLVLGYADSHQVRPKPAYITSIETSIYLAPDATGRGVGTALYDALFTALEDEDVHRAYAAITDIPNPASVALHERFGFRPIGTFREQGRKFGRYWDVEWYEKEL